MAFQIVLLTLFVLFIIIKYKQCYWKRKGIRQIDPTFFLGNFTFSHSYEYQARKLYEVFKAEGTNNGGIYFFLRPILVTMQPDVIKSILVKDFHHFVDRGFQTVNEEVDPLSENLIDLEGERWKILRAKLGPSFSPGKIKMMFQTFLDCSKGLEEKLHEYSISKEPVEIKELLSRFTTDIIGSCAFGIECNTLKSPDSEIRKYTKMIFQSSLSSQLKHLANQLLPKSILKILKIKNIRDDVEEFIVQLVKETVEYREKNHIVRKDFMHSLLQLKNMGQLTDEDKITNDHGKKGKYELSMSELNAQCFAFFAAGYETSSSTMNFAFYELAQNQDIQEKLREEVNEVLLKYNNQFTYDGISEMKYLGQLIKETLRKYPPFPALLRKCTKPYEIPGTNIFLNKGDRVHIPVLGIHMDPDYYPNPDKFDPERFTKENEEARPAYTWLPFGEGPRQCIGKSFGIIQTKIGIASIISKYKVTLNEKTPYPLAMHLAGFMTTPIQGIWLHINKI